VKIDKVNFDPWIASGITAIGFLNLVVLLQLITGIPFVGEHSVPVAVITIVIGLVTYGLRVHHYDKKKKTQNILFSIVLYVEIALLVFLAAVVAGVFG